MISEILSKTHGSLVRTIGLKKHFAVLGGVLKRPVAWVRAVDGVDVWIKKGETFGLVGESGCGKTTLAKTILRLHNPTSGHIFFDTPEEVIRRILELESSNDKEELKKILDDYDLAYMKGKKLMEYRRRMQIVFQNPFTALNPRMMIKDIVAEPLIVQGIAEGEEAYSIVSQSLEEVGLGKEHMWRYPHEFSGGQRQRIAIARAIVTRPDFIVLDEPTSSVDVSVRARLINLFKGLQRKYKLTYLFISHDLYQVQVMSDRVGVMYLGKLVEVADSQTIFEKQMHPYTQALFSAKPIPDPTVRKRRIVLQGDVPSPVNPPPGCRFHPRCFRRFGPCDKVEPPLVEVEPGHWVACHLYH
ncbi:MAG: ATP-binding cassette domain-containing protein [Candidatus Korarchaeum sp.]|nr:ATP-binding cassette domain-containing protein [Candidatus Korarchaeum sp.]MDW8034985.1 ATP-binding cassette domain-containing protein [Candidatus Korarchaeum sp.]